MSAQETTPLLPSRQDLPLHTGTSHAHKHVPISVHASQSAWPWPGPKTLLRLRAGILAYLSALVPILVRYKAAEKAAADLSSWSVVFDFSTLTHILQLLWHLLSFLWSLFHHRRSRHTARADDRIQRFLIRVTLNLSPAQAQTPSSGHFYASLLYTAAHVFNFMNATMYWAVLVPLGYGSVPRGAYGGGKALGDGWLQPFCLVNMYGVTPLIASSEVLFLNTITHQHVVASHVCSTVLLLVGYLGWAAVGNTMTGQYPFFWMDPQVMGSPKLVAACGAGFVGMGAAAFGAVYALTAVRETLAKYASQRSQYTPVHDSGDAHVVSSEQSPQSHA